jgi:transcriptional enhancer factor
MELPPHISRSKYSWLLDDHSGSKHRSPLTEADSNVQVYEVPSTSYFGTGIHHLRPDKSMYVTPVVPSQGPGPQSGNRLDIRRRNTRRNHQQQLNYSRNPVIDSKQYQAYRDRQRRVDNKDELKWPDILEIAFLDGTQG